MLRDFKCEVVHCPHVSEKEHNYADQLAVIALRMIK